MSRADGPHCPACWQAEQLGCLPPHNRWIERAKVAAVVLIAAAFVLVIVLAPAGWWR